MAGTDPDPASILSRADLYLVYMLATWIIYFECFRDIRTWGQFPGLYQKFQNGWQVCVQWNLYTHSNTLYGSQLPIKATSLGANVILVQQIYKGKIVLSFLPRNVHRPLIELHLPWNVSLRWPQYKTPLYSSCRYDYAITPWGVIGDYMDYWRFVDITGDRYRDY